MADVKAVCIAVQREVDAGENVQITLSDVFLLNTDKLNFIPLSSVCMTIWINCIFCFHNTERENKWLRLKEQQRKKMWLLHNLLTKRKLQNLTTNII